MEAIMKKLIGILGLVSLFSLGSIQAMDNFEDAMEALAKEQLRRGFSSIGAGFVMDAGEGALKAAGLPTGCPEAGFPKAAWTVGCFAAERVAHEMAYTTVRMAEEGSLAAGDT